MKNFNGSRCNVDKIALMLSFCFLIKVKTLLHSGIELVYAALASRQQNIAIVHPRDSKSINYFIFLHHVVRLY